MSTILPRAEFHAALVDILGSENVYFQPPPTVQLKYPCIVYSVSDVVTRKADNRNYNRFTRYTVIFVSKDPDASTPDDLLEELPNSSYDRHYTSDNLNHDVLTIYWEGGYMTVPEGTPVYWVDIVGKPDLVYPKDLTWDNILNKPDLVLRGDIANVYRYKGTVSTYDALPLEPEIGDTYNVADTGMNYAWAGFWDALGGVFSFETITSEELTSLLTEVFGDVAATGNS